MQALGWDESAFAAYAVRDVQDLAAALANEKDLAADLASEKDLAAAPAEEKGLPLFFRQEDQLAAALAHADDLSERLNILADKLAEKKVVIATEVGGGVVPIDPDERRSREAAGRLACLLAERADTVVRVCCGLPRLLKGSQLP